jgi:uncharacterized protein (DUF1330 family)
VASVYFIASYDIIDVGRYEQERAGGPANTRDGGGEVIVASGSASTIEGTAPAQTVVLCFPSEQAFHDWYDGEEYAPLLQLRLATTTNATAVLANEFTPGRDAS